MRSAAAALLLAALLAACATLRGPYEPPTPQTQCERSGGWWRPAQAICEMAGGGGGGGGGGSM